MREISKELKEAKKELFVARRNCILGYTKAATVIILSGFGPAALVGGIGGAIVKKMKEKTVEVPYIEEILIDNKGDKEVSDIKEEDKKDSFYKVYTDCSELNGKYVVSYELYTGDDITYENLDLVNSYDVPAYKVFEYQVTGVETTENPIDKGYSVARVYSDSNNTYERPIQKGDDDYTTMRTVDIIKSALCGSFGYLGLRRTFFRDDNIYDDEKIELNEKDYINTIKRKKYKVKSLKMKMKS